MKSSSKREALRPALVGLIVLAFFLKYAAYALFVTPLWAIPDETGHYSYVEDISDGRIPALGQATMAKDVAMSQFRARQAPNWIAQHPPLYYALAAPMLISARALGLDFDSQVRSVRLLSSLFGALAVFGFIRLIKEVTGNGILALACAIFFGCTPMFIQQASGVSHDSLVACLSVWATYWCSRWSNKNNFKDAIWCSIFIALGLITKATVLALAVPLYFAMSYRLLRREPLKTLSIHTIKQAALLWLVMFVPVCIWMIRNVILLHHLIPSFNDPSQQHTPVAIGFFEYMRVQPFWQQCLINYVGLFLDLGYKIHQVPTAMQVSGLALSYFEYIFFLAAAIAIIHTTVKRGSTLSWKIALFCASCLALALAITISHVEFAAIGCGMIFLALAMTLTRHLLGKLSEDGTRWLLITGSLCVIFFAFLLYQRVWADYYGELRAAQGRYFYPVIPFLATVLAYPLRGERLSQAALYASLGAALAVENFYLHHALKFYGQL
jgi:4-amino-4-deoxy-L-arabinose transferase-like glycosyltransferase